MAKPLILLQQGEQQMLDIHLLMVPPKGHVLPSLQGFLYFFGQLIGIHWILA